MDGPLRKQKLKGPADDHNWVGRIAIHTLLRNGCLCLQAWEEITAAVNAVQAPGSQLRNAQTCRKKWENLKLYAKKAQKEGRSKYATVSNNSPFSESMLALNETINPNVK